MPLIAAACCQIWGWRQAMFVPGILCIIAGFFVINRLRDTPRSLGLPTIEKFKGDFPERKGESEKSSSAREILFNDVLKNKFIITNPKTHLHSSVDKKQKAVHCL